VVGTTRSLIPSHGFNESAQIRLRSSQLGYSSSVVLRGCRVPSLKCSAFDS
jgi:hypothetical protein